jgi:hypothetical protein
VDFGDIKISRKLKRAPEGFRASMKLVAPDNKSMTDQAYIDALAGKLRGVPPIDPGKFSDWHDFPGGKQMQRKIAMSFLKNRELYDECAAKRKKIYDERAAINREITKIEGQLAGMKTVEVPGPEKSLADLTQKLQTAMALDTERSKAVNAINYVMGDLDDMQQRLNNLIDKIALRKSALREMRAALEKAERDLEEAQDEAGESEHKIESLKIRLAEQSKRVEEMPPSTTEAIKTEVNEIEAYNKSVREAKETNKKYFDKKDEIAAKEKESQEMTNEIERIDRDVNEAMAREEMPNPKMGFTEDGITYNGIPYEQCSESARDEVAIDVALARIPKNGFRIVPIEHWDAFGPARKERILALTAADKKDFQIWAMMVRTEREKDALFIEDGVLISEQEAKEMEDNFASANEGATEKIVEGAT